MTITLFRSTKEPDVFGFTVDPTGSNLPAQLGPWQSAGAGTVATSYAETNLDGLALSDPVMRAIKQDGFYLTRSGVTDTVTLDKVASTDDRRITHEPVTWTTAMQVFVCLRCVSASSWVGKLTDR
jgi:hypothetical protein